MGSSGAGGLMMGQGLMMASLTHEPCVVRLIAWNYCSAGKTTLLNMLAGRLSAAGNGKSEGRILVNGKKRDIGKRRHSARFSRNQDIIVWSDTLACSSPHSHVQQNFSLRAPRRYLLCRTNSV